MKHHASILEDGEVIDTFEGTIEEINACVHEHYSLDDFEVVID